MSHKKTFDPDDSISGVSVYIMRQTPGFEAVTVRFNVDAFLKPNERQRRGRSIQIAVKLAHRTPSYIALAFADAADQLLAATRKSARLNRLGTPIKKGRKP